MTEIKPVPISKKMAIQYDGKQFFVRFPKEIVEYFNIEKGDKFYFDIEMGDKPEDSIKKFDIIKDDVQR